MPYHMRIVGVKPRPDPVKFSSLGECPPDTETQDGPYSVPDGCCTYGRSIGMAHGKFSGLNASRSLDAQEERDRVGLGTRSAKVGTSQEGDETIARYLAHQAHIESLIEKVEVEASVGSAAPVFTIGGRDYKCAKIRVKRIVLGNGNPGSRDDFWS